MGDEAMALTAGDESLAGRRHGQGEARILEERKARGLHARRLAGLSWFLQDYELSAGHR
jgi:hypothetical protein